MSTNRAKFTQMKDGDAEDYAIIAKSNASDYDYFEFSFVTLSSITITLEI